MIAIIDYGLGNAGAVQNILRYLGHQSQLTRAPEELGEASRLILPGVGSFDEGVRRLHEFSLIDVLTEIVLERGTPILGICLGMQLLARRSEEGVRDGLGWIDADVVKLRPADPLLPVPNMGWRETVSTGNPLLFAGLPSPRFYFVHSYQVKCRYKDDVIATTQYGGEVCAAVRKKNVLGCQFHPEKSHKYGMALLDNFVRQEWSR